MGMHNKAKTFELLLRRCWRKPWHLLSFDDKPSNKCNPCFLLLAWNGVSMVYGKKLDCVIGVKVAPKMHHINNDSHIDNDLFNLFRIILHTGSLEKIFAFKNQLIEKYYTYKYV